MKFDQCWAQLRRKRANLDDLESEVTMTAGNLKQLLRQMHEQGEAEGHSDKSWSSKEPA